MDGVQGNALNQNQRQASFKINSPRVELQSQMAEKDGLSAMIDDCKKGITLTNKLQHLKPNDKCQCK